MLHTQKIWEEITCTQRLSAIFDLPGMQRFHCVEAARNDFLFHVDIVLGTGTAGHSLSRLILDDFSAVAKVLSVASNNATKLSLQTPRIDGEDYRIIPIKEILAISYDEDDIDRRFQIPSATLG